MPTQTTYHIEGMTRWSNAEAVAGRLSALPRVQDVRMDIVAGTALITSDAALPVEQVHAAVAEAGHALVTSPPGVQDGSSVGLSIFIGGLVAALIAGFALAKVITPAEAAPVAEPAPSPNAHLHGQNGDVGGLSISSAGYTLVPKAFAGGLSFVIRDAQGQAVTRFATVHEKPMHLVLVRRDLTRYQHVHPVMTPDGVWTVATTLTGSGPWRVFADFTVTNASYAQIPVTLGYDLLVSGEFQARPLPAPARESTAGSATVTYEGSPRVGALIPLLFRVFENGTPVTHLQPYLGSFGHPCRAARRRSRLPPRAPRAATIRRGGQSLAHGAKPGCLPHVLRLSNPRTGTHRRVHPVRGVRLRLGQQPCTSSVTKPFTVPIVWS